MTMKHSDNGDVVRLSTRDWIWLITLAVSLSVGMIARIESIEWRMEDRFEKRLERMDSRLSKLERKTP